MVVVVLLLLAALAAAQGGINQGVVSGSVGRSPALAGVSVEQKIGAVPPLDVPLVDDRGHATNMGRLFRGRPLVVLPIFYRCNGVCTTEMQGVLNALAKNPKLVPGKDLDVVVLGLNPKETPDLARAKKAEYLEQYGHRETADGWTFLTAPEAEVQRVAKALGVHYTYDPEHDRVNHPSAVLVLTPGARVSAGEVPAETYILSADRWQIELLAGLDRVPATGALVVATWPKPQEGSGFPARAFAIFDRG